MVYPRLKLGHSLLRDDGFIVVSVDDGELGNLRTILNEVFGEENFVATLVFDRNRKNDAKLFSVGHEYMVVYARNKSLLTERDVRLRAPKEGIDEVKEEFERLRKLYNGDWNEVAKACANIMRLLRRMIPVYRSLALRKSTKEGPIGLMVIRVGRAEEVPPMRFCTH